MRFFRNSNFEIDSQNRLLRAELGRLEATNAAGILKFSQKSQSVTNTEVSCEIETIGFRGHQWSPLPSDRKCSSFSAGFPDTVRNRLGRSQEGSPDLVTKSGGFAARGTVSIGTNEHTSILVFPK